MPVRLNSSGGGSVTLDVPSTAGTFTATVPANTGTLVTTGSTAAVTQGMLASGVAGNGPAFSAMNSTTPQTIASTVATKVNLTVELFDTANCFDPVTNYRFTPNISGYYNINGSIYVTGSSIGTALAMIYKNGSPYIGGAFQSTTAGGGNALSAVSSLIFMNGTTDFLELYAYVAGTGTLQLVDAAALGLESQMSGFLARAA